MRSRVVRWMLRNDAIDDEAPGTRERPLRLGAALPAIPWWPAGPVPLPLLPEPRLGGLTVTDHDPPWPERPQPLQVAPPQSGQASPRGLSAIPLPTQPPPQGPQGAQGSAAGGGASAQPAPADAVGFAALPIPPLPPRRAQRSSSVPPKPQRPPSDPGAALKDVYGTAAAREAQQAIAWERNIASLFTQHQAAAETVRTRMKPKSGVAAWGVEAAIDLPQEANFRRDGSYHAHYLGLDFPTGAWASRRGSPTVRCLARSQGRMGSSGRRGGATS